MSLDIRNGMGETWNYLRMSTDLQEDSPTTQDQHTAAFIQEQQLPTWTRTYYDLGVSAGTVEQRAGILALLSDAEQYKPTAIVFYKLDRAFRNAAEQAVAMRRLKKLGIKVLKVRDPNMDGPTGELVDNLLGAVAQFERELTGQRIRDHNQAMAQRGEWPGGAAPFGYQYRKAVREQRGRKRVTIKPGGLEPHPVEWPIARQIWDWALQGYRKVEIVDLANKAGYRRRSGRLWNTEAITLMLISRTYAGYVPFARHKRVHGRMQRRWDRAEWYPGRHKAMITMDEWHRVQATTNSRMGQRQAHSRPRCELAGLIRCRICGGPVTGKSYTSDGGYHYTCQQSLHHSAGHKIWSRRDWVVHEALKALLDTIAQTLPDIPPATSADDRREALRRDVDRLKDQRKRMRTLFEIGEYDDDLDAYRRRAKDLERHIAAKEAEIAAQGPSNAELAELWAELKGWEELYESESTVRHRQWFWGLLFEQVLMEPLSLTVRLRDFGPSVPREWEVDLPPLRTRRPGSRCGTGIVGVRQSGKSRSYLLNTKCRPVPTGKR